MSARTGATRLPPRGGAIGWMARHPVMPNLAMLALVLGGLVSLLGMRQQTFPDIALDAIEVSVALPGAAPDEVERGVTAPIEAELADLPGVAAIEAEAREGAGSVTLQLARGTDRVEAWTAVRQAVDRVTTLPRDAEEPRITLHDWRPSTMRIAVHGAVDDVTLRDAVETLRLQLLAARGITLVRIDQPRDREIAVEVGSGTLRALGLTHEEIAATIRQAALDRGSGAVATEAGTVLLQLSDRREAVEDFADIPVATDADGSVLRLGQIATVREALAEGGPDRSFDGRNAIILEVFRGEGETPIGVSRAVRAALPGALAALPDGIDATIVKDHAEGYEARIDQLLANGVFGLGILLLVLGLFLELRLAFWVAVGIPTAFLGAFIFLPGLGLTLDIISLFAFLLALGIVVDDAIVVGENIWEYLERGLTPVEAAVQGAREIAVPLSFSIVTNMIAFLPLLALPGWMGLLWLAIPAVTGVAFLISWAEALFVLPGHIARTPGLGVPGRRRGPLGRVQEAIAAGLAWFVARVYAPVLRAAIGWRYTVVAAALLILAVAVAWPVSGRMGFNLWPSIPRDTLTGSVWMPLGTSPALLETRRDEVVARTMALVEEKGGEAVAYGVAADINENRIDVEVHLQPGEDRPVGAEEFTKAWRDAIGPVPGATRSTFSSTSGGPGDDAGLKIALFHPDDAVLDRAGALLAGRLAEFAQLSEIEVGRDTGKPRLSFSLTEAGRALGLTSEAVAAQLRGAFLGVEALKQQSGQGEITVRVRSPEAERRSLHDVETLLIRTPEGGEVRLGDVARVTEGRAPRQIRTENGRRRLHVSARVDPPEAVELITRRLETEILPALEADVPGLRARFAGRQATLRSTLDSLTVSVSLALLAIYAALAIPFRSWVQPLIVMAAIPFGFAGAMAGHLLMDMSLSVVSLFGTIALGGVVINAALVMVDLANRLRAGGAEAAEAIVLGATRRFRPILLTTITTFAGLAPMIFETARDAQFLRPMAVSLGYGIVFATVVVLVLIPALYMVVEDVRDLLDPKPRRGPAPVTPDEGQPQLAAE